MSTPHPLILAGWIVADLTVTIEVVATVLLTAGAIGLGVAVFVWARNWRRQQGEEPTIEAQIESYRHMLEQGLIDDDEYDRIVAQLQSPPGTAPPGTAPPASPPPSEPAP